MYGIKTPNLDSTDFNNFIIHTKVSIDTVITYGGSLSRSFNDGYLSIQFIYDSENLRRTTNLHESIFISRTDKKKINALIATPIKSSKYKKWIKWAKENNKKIPDFITNQSFLLNNTTYGIDIKDNSDTLFSTRFKNVRVIDFIPFPIDRYSLTNLSSVNITYKNCKKVAIALPLMDRREFTDSYHADDFLTYSVKGNVVGIKVGTSKPTEIIAKSKFEMLNRFADGYNTMMIVIDISDMGV